MRAVVDAGDNLRIICSTLLTTAVPLSRLLFALIRILFSTVLATPS